MSIMKLQIFCTIVLPLPFLRVAAVAASEELKLNMIMAMDMSGKNSVNTKVTAASVEENRAKKNQTLAQMGPSLTLDSTQAWLSQDVNKAVGKTVGLNQIPSKVSVASLTVIQPIVPLAALYMKLKTDIIAVKISEIEAKQSIQNARFLGAESFVRAKKAEQFSQIAESSLKLVQKQKQDAEAMFTAGKLTNVDILKLELALADSKMQLEQAKNIKEISMLALSETIGFKDYTKLKIDPNTQNWEYPKYQRDEFIQRALSNRAEIQWADARVTMAQYYRLAIKADYLPMLNAFAKYERDFQKKDLTTPTMYFHQHAEAASNAALTQSGVKGFAIPGAEYRKEDLRDNFSFGLNLKWTLWDWGLRGGRVDELSANILKAQFAKQGLESGVLVEVTQAFLDYEYSMSVLEMAKAAFKFSEEAYKQQYMRFQNGAAAVTDIIQAERDQTKALGNLEGVKGDLTISWLKLFKVIGVEPPITNNR